MLASVLLRIYQSSFLSSLTLVLMLGAAFTVSLLVSLGLAVLPLVDKGHLLVLLAFYSSGIAVVLRFIMAAVRMAWAMASNSVEDWIGTKVTTKIKARSVARTRTYYSDDIARIAVRIAKRRIKQNWYWYAIGVTLSLVPYFLVYGLVPWGYLTGQNSVLTVLLFIVTLAIILSGQLLLVYTAMKAGRHESVYRFPLAMVHLLLLIGAYQAGGLWIAYLRDDAPSLMATVAGWDNPTPLRIALPANDGLLVYVDGASDVSFLPWHRIEALTPLSQDPDGVAD
jgi:hypothetical protein